MATIVKRPSGTWKAIIRKADFPTCIKTFRLKRDAEDWARRTEDEMVRGVFIQRAPAERTKLSKAIEPRFPISPIFQWKPLEQVIDCDGFQVGIAGR